MTKFIRRINSTLCLGDKISANIALCEDCGKILVSNYAHDFNSCKCGAFTHGGLDYVRRTGNVTNFRVFKDAR